MLDSSCTSSRGKDTGEAPLPLTIPSRGERCWPGGHGGPCSSISAAHYAAQPTGNFSP